MSLIEQRNAYAHELQKIVDARKNEIEVKVANYRAELESKLTVTPEMQKLSNFILQLNDMIAYESAAVQKKDEVIAVCETVKTEETFCENKVEDNITVSPLIADAMDTRERLKAVEQSRPGMPNVVLPTRQ